MRTGATHYGVRVDTPGMKEFFDTPIGCEHISSIISEDTAGNYVEIGWVNTKAGLNVSNCVNSGTGDPTIGDNKPKVFRSRSKDGGATWTCTAFGDLDSSTTGFDEFDTADKDGNQTWNFHMNGLTMGGYITMPFANGAFSQMNGERYGPNDSERASFQGLQFMHLNGPWTDWNSANCVTSIKDPNDIWHAQAITFTWIEVSTTTAPPC
jgi:hypothetical protein